MSAVTWTIGCVEDDPDQAALLRLWLEQAGYGCAVFRSASDFRRRLGNEAVDLVLLDRSLPDAKGLDVLAWIRQSPNSRLPVIFLTASGQESDIIEGLAAGADDYVVKPFSPKEVVARVRAVLRRSERAEPSGPVIRAGDVTVDLDRMRVTVGPRECDLTRTEISLLATLARQPGRVFTRTQLLDAAHGAEVESYERAIDAHVKNIRRKIEPDPRHPRYVLTVHSVGYRFADVE